MAKTNEFRRHSNMRVEKNDEGRQIRSDFDFYSCARVFAIDTASQLEKEKKMQKTFAKKLIFKTQKRQASKKSL